jgi:hypothetical protein
MMEKKRITLIVISIVMILLSGLAFGLAAFYNMIIKMEISHTIGEFGPSANDPVRKTYDNLYAEALAIAHIAHTSAMAFCITLAVGLLAIGIICAFWARDLKWIRKENDLTLSP